MGINLHEIENLTAEGLKENGPILVDQFRKSGEGLDSSQAADLFERFIRARFDAKLRDVTLSGQGKTITALQAGIDSITQERDRLNEEVGKLQAALGKEREANASNRDTFQTQVGELQKSAEQLRAEAQKQGKLARERRGILAEILSKASAHLAAD